MKRADYALIGITIVASLLVAVPFLIGLNNEGYLPVVFAQVNSESISNDIASIETSPNVFEYEGPNYNLIEDYNTGTATWTNEKERIEDGTANGKKVFKDYILREDGDRIYYESMQSTIIYNKSECAYTVYPVGKISTSILPSVSWIARTAPSGTDDWTPLTSLNNQNCNVQVSSSPDKVTITSTKKLDGITSKNEIIEVGETSDTSIFINGTTFDLITLRSFSTINNSTGQNVTGIIKGYTIVSEVPIQNGKLSSVHTLKLTDKLKETFTIHNNDIALNNNKFGATQTINTGATLTINDTEYNIADSNGLLLDRTWIEENKAQIFEIANNLNYDFDVGFEKFWAIRILNENNQNKIALDYSNGGNITPVGGVMEIDPTFSGTGSISNNNYVFNLTSLGGSNELISGTMDGAALTAGQLSSAQSAIGGSWTSGAAGTGTTFTVTSGGNVETLVVAGGGAGGGSYGGGGGAGGLLYSASKAVTPQTYTITVGQGASGQLVSSSGYNYYSNVSGKSGTNSVFDTLTAIGGGGGRNYYSNAYNGGSGGGGSMYSSGGGSGTAGQGYAGGTGWSGGGNANYYAGGGGGAGGTGFGGDNGSAPAIGISGNGGIGLQYSISGTAQYYAGGGGGARNVEITTSTGGLGGSGIGGNGGAVFSSKGSTNGVQNTGSGGGGGQWDYSLPMCEGGFIATSASAYNTGCFVNGVKLTYKTGDGANGVVIISYNTGSISATGGAVTTSGGKTIHKFLFTNPTPVLSLTYNILIVPDAPTSLVATASSSSAIGLTWTAPSQTVTGYKIERESGGPIPFTATGGTITYSGGYTIHTFLLADSGTNFTPNGSTNVETLVVAGGGAGGGSYGGGGGAGGLLYSASKAVTPQAYQITVGKGASGQLVSSSGYNYYSNVSGKSGTNSVFDSLTSIGGGGGRNYYSDAQSGGSGGGGSMYANGGGAGTAGQGYAGGAGWSGGGNANYYAGGGGGAGGTGFGGDNGSAPAIGISGNGGIGLQYSISGTAQYYAGGGGGARNVEITTSLGGLGGSGVGGQGGSAYSGKGSTNGVQNTGSGGGGGEWDYYLPMCEGGFIGTSASSAYNTGCFVNGVKTTYKTGDGANGVVIIRYLTSTTIPPVYSTISANTGTTATSYSDTGLTANTLYNYKVSSRNSVVTSAAAATGGTWTIPPSDPPTNVVATNGVTQANLSWTAPQQPTGGVLQAYKIYKNSNGGLPPVIPEWKVHTFTSGTSNFVVTGSGTVEYLVVAGGGGGGIGGGGGAGGYRTASSYPVTAQAYTITVGAGGTGSSTSSATKPLGGSSIFDSITSTGGAGGGYPDYSGMAGGSGGGIGGNSAGSQTGGAGNTPSTSPSQGNNGGGSGGFSGVNYAGAGGGGAGAVGQNRLGNSIAGAGGAGTANSITGSSVTYAGGGGGGSHVGGVTVGAGGSGGGGSGAAGSAGTAGTANTGGGGGGGNTGTVSGGSGIVIIKYLVGSGITATGGDITTLGGSQYKVHTFTSGTSNFVVTGSGTVEYLVIGGGGSGGGANGSVSGGGGAGAYRTASGFPVTAQTYTITVGNGGVGVSGDTNGNNGNASIFSTITSNGGGYGGQQSNGGGGGENGNASGGGEGWASGGDGGGTAGAYGNAGGTNLYNAGGISSYNSAGGGGGSSSAGQRGQPNSVGGDGGAGTSSSITGSPVIRAGGGGGGGYGGTSGTGGAAGSGGATAGTSTGNTSNAIANTGSGSGGASKTTVASSGNGGSGIVIIKYLVGSGITATGGDITTLGGPQYKIHTFTSGTSNFVVTGLGNVEYLVIGGGGGAGVGAGGAGQFATASSFPVSSQTYAITVGIGGIGGNSGITQTAGSPSTFASITAVGGGKGGLVNENGGNGGSGGGAGASGTPKSGGTASAGFNGGSLAFFGAPNSGSGGGGASAVGSTNQSTSIGGNGGAGINSSITGASDCYAGGGGGGIGNGGGTAGTATCGGGNGSNTIGTAGTDGKGGGGGGGHQTSGTGIGGAGGKGIVIIKYPNDGSITATGGNISYTGGAPITDGYVLLAQPSGTGTSYTDLAVVGGVTYVYKVIAINNVGDSAMSSPATVLIGSPSSAPLSLTSGQTIANQIKLNWLVPSSSGSSAITNYKIYLGNVLIDTVGNVLTYTDSITGAEIGASLSYKVTAINGHGESVFSNTSTITSWNVPGQVVGTGTSAVQPILNWVAPSSDGVITNYKIFRDGSLLSTLGNVLTYTDVTGTTPGQSYEYNISAVSAVGEGTQSADIIISAGTIPNAPTNLTVTPLAGADHRLNWIAPSYNGGIAISNYIVQRSESSNTGFTTIATVGNVLIYTDQDVNLTLNTIYYYKVLAVNSIGNSVASNVANGLTGDKPNTITDVTVTAVANKQINVNWSAPNANYYSITGYQVFASENGAAAVSVGTPTITSFQHTNLNIGSTYTYSVYAINSLGTSSISNTPNALAGDIPGVPTNLTVTPIIPSRLDVSWGASTSNAYTPTYTLAFSTNSGLTWNETTYTNLSVLTQSNTNLVNGQTYQYKVSATNTLGTSAYTAVVSGKAGDVPATPTNIQITTVSTTQLTFAWGVPNDNGYILTGYLVEQSNNNQQWTILNSNYQSNVYYDSGLTQNTQYYYRVSAINALGTSAPSTPASGQTFGVPNVINNLTTTTISTSQIDLAWSNPALNGYAFVGYTVQRSLDTITWVTQTVTSNNSYQDSQNTSVNTKYYYRVITSNTFGSSAPSNVAIGYTLPTATAAVTTTVQSNTQIDLVWNNPSGTAHTGFFIEQSVTAGNTWITLATTTNQNLSYNVVNLTPLTDYQFRVSTVNPSGTSGPSPVATAKTFGSPEVPTGTTATPLIGSQIRLDWVTPSNTNGSPVTGYKIERSTNNGSTWGVLVLNTNNVYITYTDTGLTTTQQYNYRISAINIYGTGQPGAQAFATASDVPSQVTGLTATPSINYTIDLSWTTPNGNGYPITGYKIERNIAGAGWVILVANTASTVTNYDDINLTANISYQYRVSAINFVGTGVSSTIATSNAGDVPNAPVLTLTALPNSIIKLDWTIPSSNGFAITTYQVEKSINGGSSWTSLTSVNANTFQDTGLINGNTYQYRISATNQIGSSVFSSNVSIIAGDTPGSVNPLTTTTLSNTSIQLNWVSPNTNGYTVTGYKIERSIDTGLTWSTVTANTQSVATIFTDTGLTTGTYYTYKVYGINALGIGVASSISTTHAGGIPNIPVLTLTALPNSIIKLDWTTPATNGFAITSYQIEKSINGGTSWTPLTSVNANTFQDAGLINGNTYQYKISATNIIGESAFSVASSMKAGDVPSAVGSFTATTLSNTSVRLDWTAPNANGYSVTGYKVEQSIDGVTFTTTTLNTQSIALTYTVTGLNAKTDYHFKVVGINALGNGVSSMIPLAHTFGSPDAFTSMTSSSTTTSATLNWVSPYDHGSPVTSYRVEILNFVNGIGNSQWLTLTTTNGLTNTHINLQSNTQYQYRVVAINPYGTSTSNAQPITTLAVPPTLTATSISGTTINLSWTTVANSPTYNLYSSDNNITFITEQIGLTGTTYQDTGLTLGQTIYYKVSVINAGGESAQSTSAQATTWSLPGVPTSLSLTNPTPITARLTWIAPTNYGGAPSVTYNVQRSTDNANWSLYQNTSTSPFTDSVLTAGQVYYWRVNTVTAAGNSVNSNVVQYTTPSLPTAPGSLTVALTGSTNSASVLNWVAPSDTSGYNVIGYKIERNANSAGFSVLIADTGTSGTVYTNTGLSAGVEYVYRVSALTSVGLGLPSNTASIQPVLAVLTITGSPTGGNSVLISSSISVTGGSSATIIQQALYKNNVRVEIQALNVNLISGATLPTMTSYPTQTSTFFATVTLNTGFVIQSNSISLTPTAPFTSGNISLSEDRTVYTSSASCLAVGGIWGPPSNPLSDTVAVCDKSYTASNLQFTVQPTGARVIVSYQPQDINQPAIVKAITSTSSSITIATPVNSETDYYGSIIVNPNFDYTVNSDGSIVVICEPGDIMCDNSDNNPLVPGVQNSVPNGVPSERTFKSFKSPDSKRQLGLEPMGDLFGVNMIFIFVIAMAAIFTGKSAPMGVIFIAVTLGVMAYLGYLDFGSDELNTATWALIIITAILGVFLGKRWS